MNRIKKVADLTLAAFLQTEGHKLQGVKGDGHKAFFLFNDTPKLERDTLRYYNKEALVDPFSFGEILRNFKGLAVANRRSYKP